MWFPPKIYAVTDTKISGLSHTEQTADLIRRGFRLIQLRDKIGNARLFAEDAKNAVRLAHQNDAKIIINDRADVALAVGADGVHVGQDDLPPAEVRRFLGAEAIVGFSTHNVKQAVEAQQMPLDYIAVGPIFTTRTKENPDPTVGLDGLDEVRRAVGKKVPLVAIGGIKRGNFADVFRAGANTIALISELWRLDEEPLKAFFAD